ncbi:hypothetical protein [Caballeronia telluris]|uniref:Uncharacterized protein n=1 Tax=Caballeronia telluris TaxID=326475 RepID=A0A158JZ23_9BURK|nr:hypothetical protein [Caballeronia telluris]SAL74078.1 hypothetical protein AWB66_04949 [Caballeronia telluris]
MHATPYFSTDSAHQTLFADPASRASLGLIVLDGMVRKEKTGGTGNGSAAIALLDYIASVLPTVPVIVLVSVRIEGLDGRVLNRDNVTSLDLAQTNFDEALVRALSSVANVRQAPGPRARGPRRANQRIAVKIGEFKADYTVWQGKKVHNETYPYRNLQDLQQLLEGITAFSPALGGRPLAPNTSAVRS